MLAEATTTEISKEIEEKTGKKIVTKLRAKNVLLPKDKELE